MSKAFQLSERVAPDIGILGAVDDEAVVGEVRGKTED